MLNAAKFERVCGHAVAVTPKDGGRCAVAATCVCTGEPVGFSVSGLSEASALDALQQEIYRYHAEIVMDRAGWVCEKCGRVRGLQCHHRRHRSQGRDDRIENLGALCDDCHQAAHHRA